MNCWLQWPPGACRPRSRLPTICARSSLTFDSGGDHAIYCSASINLAAGVLRKITNTWIPDLFYQMLARPLHITEYHMNLAPNGEAYMGGGLYLRPRDQLKLGQLYLNGAPGTGPAL